MKFSVLMSVYFRENAVFFNQALNSLINQSMKPTEIVLVKDGSLTKELEDIIENFIQNNSGILKLISLKQNMGLGKALAIGLKECSYDFIARMDSDDISDSTRFEKQLQFLNSNPEIDIVGCTLQEFTDTIGDSNMIKRCPEFHDEMVKQIKLRSPLNHATIVFRKERVLNAGGYNGNTLLFEDYSLFLRCWLSGLKFHNIIDILYYMRVDKSFESIKRRSGKHYIEKERNFLQYAKEIGAFSSLDVFKYKLLKFPIRVLPPQVVLFIYNTFLRSKK